VAKEPVWVPRLVVDAIHLDQVRTHGGLPGLRDEHALESALARPRQRWYYARRADLASLAAAYGFGLCQNHPFRDGNKRVAFVTMVVFLQLNGLRFDAPEPEVVTVMVGLASGRCTEAELAEWLRARSTKARRRRKAT
jgi:death-on-curing protein